MYTVAFVSQKGGSGKTTLATAVAVDRQSCGQVTVLVDLDPQASASHWGDLRVAATPVVTSAPAARLQPVLEAARRADAQIAVIDTAPHASDAALAAIRAANLVVIPCRPSAADLGAIGASIDLVKIAQRTPWVLINAAPVRNPLVEQAQDAIDRYGVPTVPVVIRHRIDHVHAFTEGLSACELAPAGKAAGELQALFAWIRKQGDGGTDAQTED